MKNLTKILIEQLQDLYSAEAQLIEALPELAKAASNPELSQAFKEHLKETSEHQARLDRVAELLGCDLEGHDCEAMRGLVEEGSEIVSKPYSNESLRDILLVAAAQRVEHYEIAGYGNAIALASFLGQDEVAEILAETIGEESECDERLTRLCERKLFELCLYEDQEDDDEDEDVQRI